MAEADGDLSIGPNDALRFGLELGALVSLGWWGWTVTGGPTRYALAIGLPLVAAAGWGLFRVPNDPGPAPIAVPGPVRLGLEAAVFGGATLALLDAVGASVGLGFGAVVLGHYILARDRLMGLVADRWPP